MDRSLFIAVCVSLAVFVLLFLPIYLDMNAHYDMNGRKLAFCLRAYKLIKLIGGYIATYKGGLAVHISPKKALLIPYSDLDKERKRVSVMRTFRLKTLNITAETGAEYLLPVSIAQGAFRIYFLASGGKKEKLSNNTWLREGDILRISFHFIVRFNLYMILRNIFIYLKEKFRVLCQTKIKKSIT